MSRRNGWREGESESRSVGGRIVGNRSVVVDVFVRVAVGGVPVTVNVAVPQGAWVNVYEVLGLTAVLQITCVNSEPVSLCTPTVALMRSCRLEP